MSSGPDHYAVLGIPPSADDAELRRAYHRLALKFHPDLAGPEGLERFRRVAEAYRVLSDPEERRAYDASRCPERPGAHPSHGHRRAAGPANLIARLSGPLEALIARDDARRFDDGLIELALTQAEARRGGTAAFEIDVRVGCPTCFGLARPRQLWCARCEYEGMVRERVTACLMIPPLVADGAVFAVPVDPLGLAPSLRVRVRRGSA